MTTNNNSRLAVQAHVILHLGPNFGNLVIWGHCQYPTILNMESLFTSLKHSAIFPSLYIYFPTTQHLPFTSSLMVMPLLQLLSSLLDLITRFQLSLKHSIIISGP